MIRRPPGRHWQRPHDVRTVDFSDLSLRDIAAFGHALGIRFDFRLEPLETRRAEQTGGKVNDEHS